MGGDDANGAGEFDLIARALRPLANGAPGAFNLTDDAALAPADARVVSKDMLIAGVHFRTEDPLDRVARKALRVNLSDIAAMGATPTAYFCACAWPRGTCAADVELFARGLATDQAAFGIALYGGDTTAHRDSAAPLVVSITALGRASKAGLVRRNGARPGDDVYVSGAIGDGGLGLAAFADDSPFTAEERAFLVERYQLPTPRLALGSALAGLATAMTDVSDGLIADAAHIGAASGVCVQIKSDHLPLSAAGARFVGAAPDGARARAELATFGDDYELLFAAPPSMAAALVDAAGRAATPIKKIGSAVASDGPPHAVFHDGAGRAIPIASARFQHLD